jgi:hypothetical protein
MIAFLTSSFDLSAMDGKIEQCVCINFCVMLSKSGTFFSFEWHPRFKASRVSVQDDEHSEQTGTSKMTENVENIQESIHEDHR